MSALPDQLPGSRTPPGNGPRAGHTGQSRSLSSLHQVAGGLGFSGVMLGLLIVIISCAGFSGAILFSPAVIFLGIADIVLTVIANRMQPTTDSAVVASLFVALLCLIGGMLEWML